MIPNKTAQSMGPPWIGAAYYPELWPEDAFEADLQRIKAAGLNAVRIAEFAWGLMEPKEGCFDFKWLHRVIRRLEEAECLICSALLRTAARLQIDLLLNHNLQH